MRYQWEYRCFLPTPRNQKRLIQKEQSLCEGHLSRRECLEILKSMASENTPRSDGLPCEFYTVFWNDLAEILLSALNYSFETGGLSVSQWRCIVKLIPKKDDEHTLIKNWRPLTLLNCDYNIASKAIPSRIKTFLLKLISRIKQALLKAGVLVRIPLCWTAWWNIRKKKFRAFFLILRKLFGYSWVVFYQ